MVMNDNMEIQVIDDQYQIYHINERSVMVPQCEYMIISSPAFIDHLHQMLAIHFLISSTACVVVC